MPLRDHFRPPLTPRWHWEGFHAQWPAMLIISLNRKLPNRYNAEPRVRLGSSMDIDVAAFNEDADDFPRAGRTEGGVATAVWAPSKPTLTVATDLPAQAVYEVRVYDNESGRRLVAAVEFVSPANKDRPERRRAFVAKCASLLQNRVSIAIVDIVTTRTSNLYGDLLEFVGLVDPALGTDPPPLYAIASRTVRREDAWHLETWSHPLALGQPLPTLPLWVAENLAVPLELESSYEETCKVLRIA